MDNPLINVDFQPLADFGNNLLNKIASAIGWIVQHDTPNKQAIENFIHDIKASDLNPVLKAAYISSSNEIIKGFCNQNDIVKIACENLHDGQDERAAEMDDDWIAQFMDYARYVSNKDFQQMWGKLLAEECKNPNTVPKKLLYILSIMSPNDAKAFLALRRLTVYIDSNDKGKKEYAPIIDMDDAFLKKHDLDFDMLVDLESLGLIKMDASSAVAFSLTAKTDPIVVKYFNEEYALSEKRKEFPIGAVGFTGAGQVLCNVVECEPVDGYLDKEAVELIQRFQRTIEPGKGSQIKKTIKVYMKRKKNSGEKNKTMIDVAKKTDCF